MVNMRTIYVEVNDEGYVEGWGSNLSGSNNIHSVTIEDNDQFFYKNSLNFKYSNGSLVFDEDKALHSAKLAKKDEMLTACNYEKNLPLTFKLDNENYFAQPLTAEELNETILPLLSGLTETVPLELVKVSDDVQVTLQVGYSVIKNLYDYTNLINEYLNKKLEVDVFKMIDEATTFEEVEEVSWKTTTSDELPNQPKIEDLPINNNQEIVDKLKQENKELKQRVEFNELALMDAINMFSEMNK
ncbi:hypothetical protein PHIEF17H_0340 [Enterococcus phage phiEF17H]|uniref:Uncharacterized protein n=1 Tax=Enterococcus phage phiEF17H TaxID=2218497 RepID=A0A2Z6FZC2_9CAUD|nr:hypothetical protein PHIEF17H_0340 [Enterococcus phage phiEF17H]